MPTQIPIPTNGQRTPVPTPVAEEFNARDVVQILQSLMVKVTAEECTAQTVIAACTAAGRISELLRIHLEAKRLQIEDDRVRRAEQRLLGRG